MTKNRSSTSTQLYAGIAHRTGMEPEQVASVVQALVEEAKERLSQPGDQSFTIPELVTIEARIRPAREAGRDLHPESGQLIEVPARPETSIIRVMPLQGIKKAVERKHQR
jgi:nucleoid DNA-binding protein